MFWERDGFLDKMRIELIITFFDPENLGYILGHGVTKKTTLQLLQALVDRCAGFIVESYLIMTLCPSEGSFLSDAVKMSNVYPQVQNNMFHNLSISNMFLFVFRHITPRFLWPAMLITSGPSSDSKEILEYFASTCRAKGVMYALLAQAFVKDYCTICAMNGGEFMSFWMKLCSRRRITKTSVIRLVKKVLLMNSCTTFQMIVFFLLKCLGVKVSMSITRSNPSAARLFYGQHILPTLARIPIFLASSYLHDKLTLLINKCCPPSPDEIEEEVNEQKSDQEKEQTLAEISEHARNSQESYYSVLGVSPSSDLNAIRASYRAQSLKFHPDRVPKTAEAQQEAQERMALVNDAYATLQDPEKRAFYDARLSSDHALIFGQMHADFSNKLQSMPVFVSIPLSVAGITMLSCSAALMLYTSAYRLFRQCTCPGVCGTSAL